jgi:hypothetical protein
MGTFWSSVACQAATGGNEGNSLRAKPQARATLRMSSTWPAVRLPVAARATCNHGRGKTRAAFMKNLTPPGSPGSGGAIGAHDAISPTLLTMWVFANTDARAYGPPPDQPNTTTDSIPIETRAERASSATSTSEADGRAAELSYPGRQNRKSRMPERLQRSSEGPKSRTLAAP